jgi:1,4-dihydroxy-6-naphthoate synthase
MADKDGIITLGHSPDPDDAFMFYAIAENKIDLRGYKFEHQLQDIQTLNERATRGELHISAISIHAYAFVTDKYALLPCGASMGDGYGPIVVRKKGAKPFSGDDAVREWLRTELIAVPGRMTSAFLALELYLGKFEHVVVPFDQIFDAVRDEKAKAGLIIHEGQLTYEKAGFESVLDLGIWWKGRTGLPLPLGANVIRKDLPPPVRRDLSEILKESVQYGLAHRDAAVRHSMPYARDMDEALAGKFIGMYVNDFTLDYGPDGREAITRFLREAHSSGFIPNPVELEFVS